jgi:hypothetical protein
LHLKFQTLRKSHCPSIQNSSAPFHYDNILFPYWRTSRPPISNTARITNHFQNLILLSSPHTTNHTSHNRKISELFYIPTIFVTPLQMSEPSTIVCKCNNLEIVCVALPTGAYPHIPASERTRLSACTAVFSVGPGSLTIRALANVTVKPHSHACTDLYCTACRTTLRFFSGNITAYLGTLPQSRRREAASEKRVNPLAGETIPKFPPLIQPLLVAQHRPGNSADKPVPFEDPDFDLMFSSQMTPVVGSCRAGPEVIPGRRDLSPHSYY